MIVKYLINPTNKSVEIKLQKDEQLRLFLIFTQSIECRLDVVLSGQNAQADIYGIVTGDKNSQINIKTTQLHQAPNTGSNLLVKSVLNGQARFNFEGLIRVEKSAQKTDACQKNANLLISESAKVETKPVLEIMTNDVKCTHSASSGSIDEEQLFYLISRGLSKNKAQKMLVQGFLQEIIDKIPDIPEKIVIEQAIDKNLELV